jgi:lysophospholipid acyltransferase (LPLAT)-like uncharacterized protein
MAGTKRIKFWAVRFLAGIVLRLLEITWRVYIFGPDGGLRKQKSTSQRIYTFWHRHLLTMLCVFRGEPVSVPVSEHQDGEYVAQVMKKYGYRAVRGRTTRGSLKLLKGMLSEIREGRNCAITPDGPRGPCYSVQPGFALLSDKGRLPVCPIGIAVDKAWVFSSWDRFAVPKPFATIVIKLGDDFIPRRGPLDDSRKQLQGRMREVSREACDLLKEFSARREFQAVDTEGENVVL